jgi:hypothetical protein
VLQTAIQSDMQEIKVIATFKAEKKTCNVGSTSSRFGA